MLVSDPCPRIVPWQDRTTLLINTHHMPGKIPVFFSRIAAAVEAHFQTLLTFAVNRGDDKDAVAPYYGARMRQAGDGNLPEHISSSFNVPLDRRGKTFRHSPSLGSAK